MKWLTLKQIKQQVRVELDFHEEDDKLIRIGEGAEDTVLNICSRTYDDFISEFGQMPSAVVNASLLLVDVGYLQGTPVCSQNMSAVPYTFDILIKPYMRLTSCADMVAVQTVTIGSDVKIAFTADLPDELLLKDVDFSVVVYNNTQVGKQKTYEKSDCVMMEGGAEYVALVDTEFLGIGTYLLKLTVQIPDTDYQSGFRKEVAKINPHVQVKG